jgi:hypothetical protein
MDHNCKTGTIHITHSMLQTKHILHYTINLEFAEYGTKSAKLGNFDRDFRYLLCSPDRDLSTFVPSVVS